jgi:hypothetical protein
MNPYLTRGMFRALTEMERDDEELVWEKGGGWWIGDRRTNGKVGIRLLLLCLVSASQDSHTGKFERYDINEEGRRIIREDDYVPLIRRKW